MRLCGRGKEVAKGTVRFHPELFYERRFVVVDNRHKHHESGSLGACTQC